MSRLSKLGLSAIALGALVFALPFGAASATDSGAVSPEEAVDAVLREVADDDLLVVQTALEKEAVFGAQSLYADAILSAEITDERVFVIRYNADSPLAPALLEAVGRAA